jgi:glucose-1-phosphate thymidylyltransferase
MISYPRSTLMLAGIRDVPHHLDATRYASLRGIIGQWQPVGSESELMQCRSAPEGLAQVFHIIREFIAGDACALVLGANGQPADWVGLHHMSCGISTAWRGFARVIFDATASLRDGLGSLR